MLQGNKNKTYRGRCDRLSVTMVTYRGQRMGILVFLPSVALLPKTHFTPPNGKLIFDAVVPLNVRTYYLRSVVQMGSKILQLYLDPIDAFSIQ